MNWEKANLYVENIVPGVVLLTAGLSVWKVDLSTITDNSVLLGTIFVASSYMVGAMGNVLAYFLLNYASQGTIRPLMLRFFAPRGLESLADLTNDSINRRYSEVIDAGLSCGNARIEGEVEKRRQTGRILRSTLSPAWLTLIALFRYECWPSWQIVLVCLGYYLGLLVLYGFAEVIVFKEGLRGERVSRNQKGKQRTRFQVTTSS